MERRICLRCQKPFLSKGKFNRLCKNCHNGETSSKYIFDKSLPYRKPKHVNQDLT